MSRKLLPWLGSIAIPFRVGGLHAYTADFLCAVDSCCKGPPLRGLPRVNASTFLGVETARSGGREGPRPDTSLLFVSLWFSTASWTVFLPVSLSIMYVSLLADGGKKKQIDKHGSHYFISLWSPIWFWKVCSELQLNESLIIGCKNLSYCFLPPFLISLHSPFPSFLVFFPAPPF